MAHTAETQDGDDPQPLVPVSDLASASEPCVVEHNGEVRLRAGRWSGSGAWAFPLNGLDAAGAEPVEVGPEGKLYSFTTVHVSSSRPVPYVLGYVDFPEGLRVLATVETADPARLRCDLPVRLAREGERWWVEPTAEGSDATGADE
ncbi:MAG: OB-fold domain-containing protein [Planctomycetota bacterium]